MFLVFLIDGTETEYDALASVPPRTPLPHLTSSACDACIQSGLTAGLNWADADAPLSVRRGRCTSPCFCGCHILSDSHVLFIHILGAILIASNVWINRYSEISSITPWLFVWMVLKKKRKLDRIISMMNLFISSLPSCTCARHFFRNKWWKWIGLFFARRIRLSDLPGSNFLFWNNSENGLFPESEDGLALASDSGFFDIMVDHSDQSQT